MATALAEPLPQPQKQQPDVPLQNRVCAREADVARYTGLHRVTLRQMRREGRGPEWKRIEGSRIIVYPVASLLAWIDAQRGSPSPQST